MIIMLLMVVDGLMIILLDINAIAMVLIININANAMVMMVAQLPASCAECMTADNYNFHGGYGKLSMERLSMMIRVVIMNDDDFNSVQLPVLSA